MIPSDPVLAIENSDKAIALNKDYPKPIQLRGQALGFLGHWEEALRGRFAAFITDLLSHLSKHLDYTAFIILNGLQNEMALENIRYASKALASAKAAEIIRVRY